MTTSPGREHPFAVAQVLLRIAVVVAQAGTEKGFRRIAQDRVDTGGNHDHAVVVAGPEEDIGDRVQDRLKVMLDQQKFPPCLQDFDLKTMFAVMADLLIAPELQDRSDRGDQIADIRTEGAEGIMIGDRESEGAVVALPGRTGMTRSNPVRRWGPGNERFDPVDPRHPVKTGFQEIEDFRRPGKPMATLCRTNNCPSVRFATSSGVEIGRLQEHRPTANRMDSASRSHGS